MVVGYLEVAVLAPSVRGPTLETETIARVFLVVLKDIQGQQAHVLVTLDIMVQ